MSAQIGRNQPGASVPIKLPRWLLNTSTMKLNSVDVILLMALSLKTHGTAEQIRQLARNIRDKVCMEHRPKMRALSKITDDSVVLGTAIKIVQRGTDALGILAGEVFEIRKPPVLVEPPKCHLTPMRLAGYHDHRHWACKHCKHTKPLRQEDTHGQ